MRSTVPTTTPSTRPSTNRDSNRAPAHRNLIEVPPSAASGPVRRDGRLPRHLQGPRQHRRRQRDQSRDARDQGQSGGPQPEGINVIRDFLPQNRGIRAGGRARSPAIQSGSTSTFDGSSSSSSTPSTSALSGSCSNRTIRTCGPGCARSRRSSRRMAARGPVRRQERGRLLRAMRPLDDVTGRHRQRPSRRGNRHRADPAGRVRDFPHWPVHGRFEL